MSYQGLEDDTRVTFLIDCKSFKLTDLKTRSRFREKLKLKIYFDDKKFKTEKAVLGGGDVEWKYHNHFEWHLTSQHTSTFVLDFVRKELENRYLKIYAHSAEDKTVAIGSVSVDFYTLATGPVEHNLPLLDNDGKPVGRLSFALEMVQLSTVTVIFKEVHVKNLRSIDDEVQGVNPYLKYGYSKDWPLIVDGRMKAVYSDTQMRTMNPSWDDRGLPWLKFRTSLNELVKESLVLHVTHRGKITNTTLGRCNLLFRTLVDGGKSFKEEDLISFKGPLNKKQPDCTIEGKLVFKHLPVFAQMKPITGARPALHNEKGIYDAMPLLSWTPRPKVPVLSTESPNQQMETPKSPKKKNITRTRSNSDTDSRGAEEVKRQESFRDLRSDSSKNLRDSTTSGNSASSFQSTGSTQQPSPTSPVASPGPKTTVSLTGSNKEVPTGDLISFTPPSVRKRAVSHAPAPKMVAIFGDEMFDPTPSTTNLFASKPENVLKVQTVSPANPFGTSAPTFNPFAPQPFHQPQMQPVMYPPPQYPPPQPSTFNPFAATTNAQPDPFA